MKKLLIFLFIIFMNACNTKLMLPADGEEVVQTEAAQEGQKVFMNYCNRCHPGGNAGLGPSVINKPLPGFMIKAQVRNGFGVMPSFDKEHITDEELDQLVQYIKKL